MDGTPHSTRVRQYRRFGGLDDSLRAGQPLPSISVGEFRGTDAKLGLGAVVNDQGRIVGEATMINGHAYCTGRDGVTRPMGNHERLGFAQFANEAPEGSVSSYINARNADELIAKCRGLLAGNDKDGFVLEVDGKFNLICYRGMGDAGKCYPDIHAVLADEQHYTAHGRAKLSGVFQHKQLPPGYCPPGPEWHFHGLHADESRGGHVLDFEGFEGKVTVMPVREWQVLRAQKQRDEIYRPHCDGGCSL